MKGNDETEESWLVKSFSGHKVAQSKGGCQAMRPSLCKALFPSRFRLPFPGQDIARHLAYALCWLLRSSCECLCCKEAEPQAVIFSMPWEGKSANTDSITDCAASGSPVFFFPRALSQVASSQGKRSYLDLAQFQILLPYIRISKKEQALTLCDCP